MHYLAMTLPGGQQINPPASVPNPGGSGITFAATVFKNGLTMFIIVAVFLCLFGIIWGGAQWTMSGGDKGKIAAARGRITWAVVGLIVVFLAFFVVTAIGYFFKIKIF
jgi:hypothetical protein